MPPVGFKPTISAGERPQTDALDRSATGTDSIRNYQQYKSVTLSNTNYNGLQGSFLLFTYNGVYHKHVRNYHQVFEYVMFKSTALTFNYRKAISR